MNDALILLLATAAGVVLGAGFFGGLWWTVRRSLASQRTASWLLVSFVLRMSIGSAGLYFVSSGRWERLVACLLGFIVARFGVVWLCPAPVEVRGHPLKEAGDRAP